MSNERYKVEISEEKPLPEALYKVVVSNGARTEHLVELIEDYYLTLTEGKIKPEELVRKSFDFLLAREPNTAILEKFILNEISNYFPEYETEIRK